MDSNQPGMGKSLVEQILTLMLEELAHSEDFSHVQLEQLARTVKNGKMSDVGAVSAILQGKEQKGA